MLEWFEGANVAWLITAGTVIATARAQLATFIARVFNIVFETHHFEVTGSMVMLSYVYHKGTPYGWGPRTYDAVSQYVRPLERTVAVAAEIAGRVGRLYWIDGAWLWVRMANEWSDRGAQTVLVAGGGSTSGQRLMHVTFIRGTLNLAELFCRATDFTNDRAHCSDIQRRRRHRVNICTGTVGVSMQPVNESSYGVSGAAPQPVGGDPVKVAPPYRFLRWTESDFGYHTAGYNPLEELALPTTLNQLALEIQHWRDSQPWYLQRKIPWRISIGLHGDPGTGKTSFLRGVAEWLDLPVHVMDIASMTNRELIRAWEQAMAETPCMIVVEDVDRVFHGDQPVNEEVKLSYGTLLNCFDGLVRSDGILTAFTTNHLQHVDPALLRKGRCDELIEIPKLSEAGLLKIAQKICPDLPHDWPMLVKNGAGKNGSEFQHLCVEHAKADYWRRFREAERVA